jgi:hypothetical protein
MNKLQKFLLTYVFKDLFRPANHLKNLDEVFKLIHEDWALQFNEDNESTNDSILAESFLKSQKSFAAKKVNEDWDEFFKNCCIKSVDKN